MLLKSKVHFLNHLWVAISFMGLTGCASMQQPQGGPRDQTPPKVLKSIPENMTRNFSAKQIQITFDEYVKLSNTYQEITVSPAMEKQPEYKLKQKTLVIDFQDTLQKNTTYVINFGKAIADNTENNVLKNFTYVFSTGNKIDSLSVSGNVINTQSAVKEKDVTVMLFPARLDTALFGKKKPGIFTTTDSAGNFSLNNLHEGEYTIYALKEASPDKIYNNENELIGFRKTPVQVTADVSGLQLKLFKQTSERFRVTSKKFDNDGKVALIFNRPLNNPSLKINYPAPLDAQKIVDISKTKDTALVYLRNMDFDSLSVAVLDGNRILDTVGLRKGRKEEFKRNIGLQYNISNDNRLRPNTDVSIIANVPIDSYDPGKIKLLEDSATVTGLTVIKDPVNPKRFTIKHRWRQKTRYELIFSEEALTDIYGGKNKELTKRFQIDRPENYGVLTLKYLIPDAGKSYIVDLLDNNKNVLSSNVIDKNTAIIYRNFLTGKYRVKITYDTNKNGKYDSGNVRLKAYPENVWFYDRDITLRPNWEAEETITIPQEEITP